MAARRRSTPARRAGASWSITRPWATTGARARPRSSPVRTARSGAARSGPTRSWSARARGDSTIRSAATLGRAARAERTPLPAGSIARSDEDRGQPSDVVEVRGRDLLEPEVGRREVRRTRIGEVGVDSRRRQAAEEAEPRQAGAQGLVPLPEEAAGAMTRDRAVPREGLAVEDRRGRGDECPTRRQALRDGVERRVRIGEVGQHVARDDQVERSEVARQRLGPSLPEFEAGSAEAPPRVAEEARVGIDPDRTHRTRRTMRSRRGEARGPVARAATDVENRARAAR